MRNRLRYNIIEYHNTNTQSDTTMFYDANGNLIRDLDRGITAIKYNILNLPDTIQFSNGNQIVNLYDASGHKYKSIAYTVIPTTVTTHYEVEHYTFDTDTVEYLVKEYTCNTELCYTHTDTLSQRIFNSIGYYSDSAYYHYIKDHLGNVCAVVNSAADTVVQSTLYYASGVPMAQSWGRDTQPYLYNGKEFEETHGLNSYDYGFRGYYALTGRFTTIDPLAEQTPWQSPYVYAGNNYINNIDWMGLMQVYGLTCVNGQGKVVFHQPSANQGVYLVDDDWNEGDPLTFEMLVGFEIPGIMYEVGGFYDYMCIGGGSIFSGTFRTGTPNDGAYTYHFSNVDNTSVDNANAFDALYWGVNLMNFMDCSPFSWQGVTTGKYYNITHLKGKGQYVYRNSYKKAVIKGAKGPLGVLGTGLSALSLSITARDMYKNGITVSNSIDAFVNSAGVLGGIAALGWFGTGAVGAVAVGVAPYVLTAVAIYGVADFGVTLITGSSISGWIEEGIEE